MALVARSTERLEELAATIRGHEGSCAVISADLRDKVKTRDIVEEVAERLGRLDVLVNNAGYVAMGTVEEVGAEDVDRMVDLNLTAVLHLSQAALPHLLRAAAGGPVRSPTWSASARPPAVWCAAATACTRQRSTRCARSARSCARR